MNGLVIGYGAYAAAEIDAALAALDDVLRAAAGFTA